MLLRRRLAGFHNFLIKCGFNPFHAGELQDSLIYEHLFLSLTEVFLTLFKTSFGLNEGEEKT